MMRARRVVVALAVVAGALMAGAAGAGAQVPGRPRPVRPRPVTPEAPAARPPGVRDTTRRAAGDTIPAADSLVQWLPTDSVMEALRARPGYTITRYQGDTVVFEARRGDLQILSGDLKKSAVQRGEQTVVTDSSIFYDDSTKRVLVRGQRIVVHDPSSGQADIVGTGSLSYDFRERAGRITNPVFAINQNNQIWKITAQVGKPVQGDSAAGRAPAFYGRGGTLTSCTDSVPDYYFAFKEVKKSSANTLVARPAILYIKDIPVAWLPFIFQDTRGGRHSGILTPRFGLSDIVRNSPRYRREIDDFGYYWAISDYMDARFGFDWRSSAGDPNDGPGWTRYKGEWNYRWLDRYLGGGIATDYTRQSNGSTNLALSWNHHEEFTRSTTMNANVNYVSNTFVQRQTALNPYQALGTISSQLALNQKIGQATLALGGTRTQSPGRSQISQNLPTLTLSSPALAIASWLNWTPSLSYSRSQSLHIDQADPLSQRFELQGDSVVATKLDRSQTRQNLNFSTPIEIFGWSLRNSFSVVDDQANYPYKQNLTDPSTGVVTGTRIFTRTFSTQVDWTPEFQLPTLGQNKFKLTPTFSMQNAMSGAFWVRSQFTGGRFVHQQKRATFGLSAAPSLFGFFPGFGPFTRIRHAINPTISYTYAPAYTPDTAFLRAIGTARSSVLGLRQSSLTFGLNTNFEAKVRAKSSDTTAGVGPQPAGEKVTLLSLNTTGLSYDFERAKATHSAIRGLTSNSWGYTLSSDLLPGFSFNSSYSLFSGSVNSDTAKFSPVLTSVAASFQWNQTNNPLVVFRRLFGGATTKAEVTPTSTNAPGGPGDQYMQQLAQAPVAGSQSRSSQYLPTAQQGFAFSLNFSMNKPRRPTGSNVIEADQFAQCEQFRQQPLVYEACRQGVLANPTNTVVTEPAISGGGPAIYYPATINMGGNVNFQLTPKWSAQWQTQYDFTRRQFADHIVSLVRDLHDWRAVFAFTDSPNGNSAFSFFISLKAEPDLKFDYHRNSVRTQR